MSETSSIKKFRNTRYLYCNK